MDGAYLLLMLGFWLALYALIAGCRHLQERSRAR